jgi:hypothetical protein
VLKTKFNDDIQITPSSFKEQFHEVASEVKEALRKKFSNEKFKMFEVFRPTKGLVHPAVVLEIQRSNDNIDIYTVRYFEKNEEQYRGEEFFDRSKFFSQRILKLTQLGRFYPKIILLDLSKGILVLQDFIIDPICDFSTQKSIEELIDLVFIASELGIFLDFNQNHWLFSEENGLVYVDKDYCEEYDTFEETVYQNFNQTTLFFNEENTSYFARSLKKYQSLENPQKDVFVQIIMNQLIEKKELLEKRESTLLIQNRLKAYNEILEHLMS